jgi:hypothetical protein
MFTIGDLKKLGFFLSPIKKSTYTKRVAEKNPLTYATSDDNIWT